MKISRQAEAEIPEFNSYAEAQKYFATKYGEKFVLANIEMIGDDEVFFYHLMLDEKEYFSGREKLAKDGYIMDSLNFINSHQPIEIFHDGRIHVIH